MLAMSLVGMAQNGTVINQRKVSDTTANFTGVLGGGVNFGTGVVAIGDLNGNGISELVVGAYDAGNKGAVYTMFMNSVGGVDSFKTITEGVGGFTGTLGSGNRFGYSVGLIGDLDQDNVPDIVVSSELDDDGGSDRGAVWIVYLKSDGTVKSHTKISSTTQGSLLASPAYGIKDLDRFGSEVEGIGDLDGDTIPDIAVSAIFSDYGGNNTGGVWILFLNRNGTVKNYSFIGKQIGGLNANITNFTFWGSGLANIGDLDGDNVQDLVVGQELEDGGGTDKGALWILYMNTNGTVKSYRELRSNLSGTGLPVLGNSSYFGSACAGLGDIDGDQIPDIAVGANGTDSQRGAVYILMMNTNGTIKTFQKISYNSGGSGLPLDANDLFGNSVANIGDYNGDGKTDIAVGAAFDDDGGSDKGAVYILNLQGVPTNCVTASFTNSNSTICLGDTVTFNSTSFGLGNINYTWKLNGATVGTSASLQYAFGAAGTYTLRLVAVNDAPACIDSVETTITVVAPSTYTTALAACDGQSRFIAGAWRSVSGTYYDTLTNAVGCDSIVTVVFDVRPIAGVNADTTTICQGQSFLGYTQTGVYTDTLMIAGLCHVDLHDVRVLPNTTGTAAQTICNGDSVMLGGSWRYVSGTYNDTTSAANSCDSVTTVSLTVLPNVSSTQNISICPGQSYFAGGAAQTTAGTYYDTLQAANGCDSVVTTVLSIGSYIQNTVTQTICFGASYMGYSATGVYNDTFATIGCDSIRILNLTVRSAIATTVNPSICPGQSYFAGGATQTTAGTYYDTLHAVNGCDSVVTTVLSVGSYIQNTVAQTICFGDSYLGYNTIGVYNDTFATTGCDSIRTLDLTVLPQNVTNVTQSICQGQSFEGYSTTGVFNDTFATAGCDSIRILTLTVANTIQTTDVQTICFGSSYLGYTATGMYHDTLQSSGGCDSIHTIDLTVLPEITMAISPAICQGQSFEGYTVTGVYIDTFTATNGCDSIRTLRLTVRPVIENIVTQTICDGESFEGHTITGVYSDTLSTSAGCDSIYTLNLTVEPLPIAPTIVSNANVLSVPDTFATYQWYQDGALLSGEETDTLALSANGNYTVAVTNAAGCTDTSVVFVATGVGINEAISTLGVSVYPNPSSGAVLLMVESKANASWTLYNSIGQLLQTGLLTGSSTIDLHSYADGVYYIKVSTGEALATQRILVAK